MLVYTKYLIAVVFKMPDQRVFMSRSVIDVAVIFKPRGMFCPSVVRREKTNVIFYRLLSNEMQ